MRPAVLPAILVASAVILASGYLWTQGRSRVVDFAVVTSSIEFVNRHTQPVPDEWRERPGPDHLLVVDVAWRAEDPIDGGAYFVVVSAPTGWEPLACVPECEFGSTDDLQKFARQLPRTTAPDGAVLPADKAGRFKVAFAPRPGREASADGFQPAAWLVQTDGHNVLSARPIPAS